MSCSLFCKLSFLLRQRYSALEHDLNITVRFLKVLLCTINFMYDGFFDSVMKNSQEMIRASLLPLFNNIVEDLN
ncbi:unnamed protein product [Rotaria sp. Silwood1]|nr:unnamed protein product [Rotaria sp. Silwood1]CAF1609650.1 unnamed protein product [Rotaria sp. Silwood1]CAF3696915.1 unnamed protein product [Rotaria sp. Silwood1]CAF3701953.1 unnamed protein product [Rotaria sp. Silwood1]CAF3784144.1 unnamed protein product [Rotaria sp. Silwood1]